MDREERTLKNDWLFDSLTEYSDLHMYELHDATHGLAWISDSSLCLACQGKDGRSEILHIGLPSRMTLAGDEKNLSKERDFQVLSGGFHSKHVMQIHPFNDGSSRFLCTTERGNNCVRVWDFGLVEEKKMIKNSIQYNSDASQAAVNSSAAPRAALATHVNNLCVVDLNNSTPVYENKDIEDESRLSEIRFIDSTCLLTCGMKTGRIYTLDIREKKFVTSNILNQESSCMTSQNNIPLWTFDTPSINGKTDVLMLSSSGQLMLFDRRKLEGGAIQKFNLAVKEQSLYSDHLKIQCSPTSDGYFSVSGFDHYIHVFNINSLEIDNCFSSPNDSMESHQQSSNSDQRPIFSHKGHYAESEDENIEIFNHIWHPTQNNLLLSCASDGSLHAWQYIEKKG